MRQILVFLSLVLGLTGCADDNVSVFILGNVAPEKDDDICNYDPGSNTFVLEGTWNIDDSPRYVVFPAVANQLQRRANMVRSEPNGVHIRRAEVVLEDFSGTAINFGALPNPFSVAASTYIPPAADFTSPSLGSLAIEAIPAAYGNALRAMGTTNTTIQARVRLIGETNGLIDIETDDWLWPINVCSGACLFSCTSDETEEALACQPGQDQRSVGLCAAEFMCDASSRQCVPR